MKTTTKRQDVARKRTRCAVCGLFIARSTVEDGTAIIVNHRPLAAVRPTALCHRHAQRDAIQTEFSEPLSPQGMSRDELRKLAKNHGVRPGRNKSDTIRNLTRCGILPQQQRA